MAKNSIALFILMFLFAKSVKSCVNEYRTLLNGKIISTDKIGYAPSGRFDINDTLYLKQKLSEAKSRYEISGTIENYSDLGAILVYNGKFLEAKRIFEDIEVKSPGLYQTAANLGTTYELLGNNDSALFWIKKAIKINPNSHEGSEWIHVKILEEKIKAKGNEKLLWDNQILSLDFGNDNIPVYINKIELTELRNQLYVQLKERMSFIKPKDPIIAQLLFDLGNINALTYNVESGLEVYRLAKYYGMQSELLDKRIAHFEKIIFKTKLWSKTEELGKAYPLISLIILLILVVLLIWAIVFLIKKIRRKLKSKTINTIVIILTIFLLNACTNSEKKEQLKFNSEDWKNGDFRMKGKMVNNIINDSILIGKSKLEVLNLLGTRNTNDTIIPLVYPIDIGLKVGPFGLGGTWMFFMSVQFDSLNSKVIEVYCRD